MRPSPKFIRFALLFAGSLILVGGAASVRTQADEDPIFGSARARKGEDPPRSIQESLSRMRIEKDKKDFIEMVKRGDDAAKLAAELKEEAAAGQQEQISSIGKLVRKIHDELGAEGSGDDDTALPSTQPDAIKALREQVNGLAEDLKKTNRFTVSAAAIDRTNEILRLVKYLHG